MEYASTAKWRPAFAKATAGKERADLSAVALAKAGGFFQHSLQSFFILST